MPALQISYCSADLYHTVSRLNMRRCQAGVSCARDHAPSGSQPSAGRLTATALSILYLSLAALYSSESLLALRSSCIEQAQEHSAGAQERHPT